MYEVALVHDTYYRVVFHGNNVKAGDIAVWVRDDQPIGKTHPCQGAAQIMYDVDKNDFVHGVDDTNDPNPLVRDHGGIVQSSDIDGDGIADIHSDFELWSDEDGKYSETDYDDDDDTLYGSDNPKSRYTLCLAEYDKPASEGGNDGVPYTDSTLPTSDLKYKHYPYVIAHFFHMCAPPFSTPFHACLADFARARTGHLRRHLRARHRLRRRRRLHRLQKY